MSVTRSTLAARSAVVAAWLLSRALVVGLLLGPHSWVTGDLRYFARSVAALGAAGPAGTLVEYPLPAVVVIALPAAVVAVAGATQAYAAAVLVLLLVLDAAFTRSLVRLPGPGASPAVGVWLCGVPLLGATCYARLDMLPGVLTAVAVAAVARRPRAAGALAAAAASLKLWPVLVLPALLAGSRRRRDVLVAGGVVGGLLALAGVAVAGWSRTVSPLLWHGERGLQIEAVPATPAMLAGLVSPEEYPVAYSEHNAFEVTGPGTSWLVLLGDTATWLLAGLVLAAAWTLARRPERPAETVCWVALAAVSGFVVTGKVLSPQYLLWLLPLAAVAVGLAPTASLRRWAALLLVSAGVTQLVFPVWYAHLTSGEPAAGAVLALAVRNALLVWLAGWAVVEAWRQVSGGGRWRASRRGRPRAASAASGGAPPTAT